MFEGCALSVAATRIIYLCESGGPWIVIDYEIQLCKDAFIWGTRLGMERHHCISSADSWTYKASGRALLAISLKPLNGHFALISLECFYGEARKHQSFGLAYRVQPSHIAE